VLKLYCLNLLRYTSLLYLWIALTKIGTVGCCMFNFSKTAFRQAYCDLSLFCFVISCHCFAFLGGKDVGANPKINNLLPAYNSMKYNFFWICDSGIRVLPLTLRDLVSKMTDNVALVHAVPYTSNRKGFSAAVEKVCIVCLSFKVCFFILTCSQ